MRCVLAGAVALLTLGVCSALADEVSPVTVNLQTNDIRVAADASSVQTLHTEVYANNDAGAIRLNQVQLGYDSANQVVNIDEAYTLKPDGTKIPVDMNAIYVRLPDENGETGAVTDQRMKVIVFPQVAAGDTVVYTATVTNSIAVFPRIYTFAAAFNPSESLKEERDTITAPKELGLHAETHGVEFSSEDHGSDVVYRWHYAAAKPTAIQLAQVSPLDQLPRFFVSNFKDYGDLGRAYGALVNAKLQVTPKVAALADQIVGGETDSREQVRKIYEWVNANIRYIAIELGRGTMVPHDVDAILTYGYGDCKDHDLLLRALLKAKGIASEAVLLNGSNAYTLTQVPTFVQLDHVITYVPAMNLYLDSSALGTPFGVLPYVEYGKPAIRVAGDTATLGVMPLLSPGIASETTTNVMQLSAAGVLTGKVTTIAEGPSQIALRQVGLALQAVSPEKVAAELLSGRGYVGGSGTITPAPPLMRGPNYTIAGDYTIPGWAAWLSGKGVSIMPVGLRILGVAGDGPMGSFSSLTSNDFRPVPCFSVRQSETDSLEVPVGYKFLAVPVDTQVTTDNIHFSSHWWLTGNTLSVHRDFRSTTDKAICTNAMRRQLSHTLLQMALSYLQAVHIAPASGAPALASDNEQASPGLGPDVLGQSQPGDIVAVARVSNTDRTMHLIDRLMASSRGGEPHYSAQVAQALDDLQDSLLPDTVNRWNDAIRLDRAAGP